VRETVASKNGIPIRLNNERWAHIVEEHSEMAGLRMRVLETVAAPDRVFAGGDQALLAVRELEVGKYIVVVYREAPSDGFVITGFLTRRIRWLERRKQLWP
jgi:hypothetical protein